LTRKKASALAVEAFFVTLRDDRWPFPGVFSFLFYPFNLNRLYPKILSENLSAYPGIWEVYLLAQTNPLKIKSTFLEIARKSGSNANISISQTPNRIPRQHPE
jgi:hypothetical protein